MDMDKSEQKHRKNLNAEQLEVLELLHKFRFASNDLIAQYFGKKDRSFVFKRLSILLEQRLIGKRFDSSYRLQGKPAAYYLMPAGARVLQERHQAMINIKTIYKDKSVSEQFVRHSLDLLAIYNQLKAQYGDRFKFFTKVNLNREQFDYFPQPLPDAYIRLRLGGEEKQFFLDMHYDDQPFFAAARKIKRYIEYAESGKWEETGTNLPAVLIVCESVSLQKRLLKCVVNANKPMFALIAKPEPKADELLWQLAEWPERTVPLQSIQ
jgi:Replication-relaxation